MEIIYFLVPMAILLVAGIVAGLFWAVRSGQFDDLEGPAHQILMDEEVFADERPDSTEEAASEPTNDGRNRE
jgi:cbb3-type cytochrome oxidase maturation protein